LGKGCGTTEKLFTPGGHTITGKEYTYFAPNILALH
jgi:hypothetical protein